MDTQQIDVMVADASHEVYVDTILETIRNAAKVRGTGIAERTHEYVATKMKEGKAIIALCGDVFAGFTYIESWGNKQYVATSGLIVHPDFRGLGLAKRIKQASFQLARLRWPRAKIFSLTSGAAVMKMNTELGYVPVTFNELTDDEAFWKGCEGCINHEILMAKDRKFCICTAMLYDPTDPHNIKKNKKEITFKIYSTMEQKKKVVVAFSGGLDTSFTVMYLAKEKGYEVYAACANTGGFSEEQLKQNEENAYKLGAVKYVTLDVTRNITKKFEIYDIR